MAERKRSTKETEIAVRIDLDGSGQAKVSTGIPFFDHMLEQLGRHGGFDLELTARGDLEVDTHHTVEDTGIVLGAAFAEALGDKAGVRRFASYLLPLDEALIQVALDLSGRPFLVYEVETPRRADRHVRPPAGRGVLPGLRHLGRDHPPPQEPVGQERPPHASRPRFKGVARALRDAVRVEGGGIPSTKEVL